MNHFVARNHILNMPMQRRDSSHPAATFVSRVLICAVVAVLAGCSVRTYEERLNRSNELFKYLNTLNENLTASVWTDTHGFGISMRPPARFTRLAAPQPTEEDPAPLDQRHPAFLLGSAELPGLIEAWSAALPTTGERPLPAFLYVLGNHQRFLDKLTSEGGGPEPIEFLNDVESTLQIAVLGNNNPLPTANTGSQDNVKYEERIPRNPRVEGFPVPKDFKAVSFLPPEERIESLGGVPIRLQLFEYAPQGSNVQLAVLMIYPVSVREDPVSQLRLALETLEMNEQPPRPQRTAAEGGGGTAPPF